MKDKTLLDIIALMIACHSTSILGPTNTVYMHYIPRMIICLQKDIASVTWGKTLPLRQRLSQEDKGRHAVGKVSSSASQASLLHLKMA